MDIDARVRAAEEAEDPFTAFYDLAVALRDEGYSQKHVESLFETLRENHTADTNETTYNAVWNVLDLVVGYCPPEDALFPPS